MPAPYTACSVLETTCCFDETLDGRRRDSRRSQVDLDLRSIALNQILSLLRTNNILELGRIAQRLEQGQSDTDLTSAIISDIRSRDSQHPSGRHHDFTVSHSSSTDIDKNLDSCESPLDLEINVETISLRLLSFQDEPIHLLQTNASHSSFPRTASYDSRGTTSSTKRPATQVWMSTSDAWRLSASTLTTNESLVHSQSRKQLIPYSRDRCIGTSSRPADPHFINCTHIDSHDMSGEDFDFEDVFAYDRPQSEM